MSKTHPSLQKSFKSWFGGGTELMGPCGVATCLFFQSWYKPSPYLSLASQCFWAPATFQTLFRARSDHRGLTDELSLEANFLLQLYFFSVEHFLTPTPNMYTWGPSTNTMSSTQNLWLLWSDLFVSHQYARSPSSVLPPKNGLPVAHLANVKLWCLSPCALWSQLVQSSL